MAASPVRNVPRPGVHALLVAVVFVGGMALRAIHLGGPTLSVDEFYHAFAARSLLAGDGLWLPSGDPYTRARLVTLLTAGAFALFGESEAAARLPALAFGALTLGLTYLAGRRLFGPPAGLAALALLAFSPDAIDVDRFARLYAPLTFSYLLAALASYRALEGLAAEGQPGWPRRGWGWAALAGAAGLLALHLHTVALGLGLVVQAYAAARALGHGLNGQPRAAARYGALALALLGAEGAALALRPVRAALVTAALTPLPWYQPAPGDAMTYHYHLAAEYGWLWFAVWPATVLLGVARPRPGLFVGLAFWLPFGVISALVATKSTRYVVHLLPFAWLLVGGAAGVVWPAARAALQARLAAGRLARVPPGLVAAGVLVVALAPLVRLTPSVVAAVRRPWQTTGAFTTARFYDWRALADALGPRLPSDAAVVAAVPLAVRYYLERPAYRLLAADRSDWHGERRPVQRPADLAALRAEARSVWILVEQWRWETPGKVDAGLKTMVTRECLPLPLPPTVALLAFDCSPAVELRSLPERGRVPTGRDQPRSGGSPPGGSPR